MYAKAPLFRMPKTAAATWRFGLSLEEASSVQPQNSFWGILGRTYDLHRRLHRGQRVRIVDLLAEAALQHARLFRLREVALPLRLVDQVARLRLQRGAALGRKEGRHDRPDRRAEECPAAELHQPHHRLRSFRPRRS